MDSVYNTVIESLIFSSDEPISAAEIVRAIKGIDGEEINISKEEIEDTVDQLNQNYSNQNISPCSK